MQGTKAFCSGGDQSLRGKEGYVDYDSFGRLNVLDLQVHLFKHKIELHLSYHFREKSGETFHSNDYHQFTNSRCRCKYDVFPNQL